MKLIAKQTIIVDGKRYRAGDRVNVNIPDGHPARALFREVEELKDIQKRGRQTKEDKTFYRAEKKGSWYTVYEGEEIVEKFQGAGGLKKYGLGED